MFKFLFGKKGDEVAIETQRQTAERSLEELNTILAGLEIKPAVQLDMSTGQISVTWPDQMPDEALALPAPDEKTPEAVEKAADAVEDAAEKVAA